MHVWPASSEFNQARPGRNLQQNTQQMLTLKSQPEVTMTGQNLWGFLSQVHHLEHICLEQDKNELVLGQHFGYSQRNL